MPQIAQMSSWLYTPVGTVRAVRQPQRPDLRPKERDRGYVLGCATSTACNTEPQLRTCMSLRTFLSASYRVENVEKQPKKVLDPDKWGRGYEIPDFTGVPDDVLKLAVTSIYSCGHQPSRT